MPATQRFDEDLRAALPLLLQLFPAPFHLMDEAGIMETANRLTTTLRRACTGYRNFYAVKANSNPVLLKLLYELGMGFDCSSEVEVILARQAGAKPEDIFFTSNNTSREEFEAALTHGCILNFDDITLIKKVPVGLFPDLICIRYNPGKMRVLRSVIGNPEDCKYGVPHEQIVEAYRQAQEAGATRFGLHTMLVSNERNWECHAQTAKMLLEVAAMIEHELGIRMEFINIGGGLGIPYRPTDEPLDLDRLADEIKVAMDMFEEQHGYCPRLYSENGRYVTGPNGVFIAQCINEKHGYREFRGVNASAMAAIMRPPMYHPNGGYHEITVLEPPTDEPVELSIVGPACEDSDRFGWDRKLSLHEGQHIIVHDTGAHAPEMGNMYNNRPRPAMLMLGYNGIVELIEPAQTTAELLARRYRHLAAPWSCELKF